jgi:heme exporter protein D
VNRPRSFAERRQIITKVEERMARGESQKDACLAEGTTAKTLQIWKRIFRSMEVMENVNQERASLQQNARDQRKKGYES